MIQPGLLALQGDIQDHAAAFASLGHDSVMVKTPHDLGKVSHLIIPGGESTVIGKLLGITGLDKAIQKRVKEKSLAVYGTCAGAIVLANEVESSVPINHLSLIDVTVSRNAYGSQVHSFTQELLFPPSGKTVEVCFIRAPKITKVGKRVESRCSVTLLIEDNGLPLMVQQDNVVISTFHPEFTRPAVVHEWFLATTPHHP